MTLRYWLAANHLPFASQKILDTFTKISSPEYLFTLSAAELASLGWTEKQLRTLRQIDWSLVDAELAWGEQPMQHIISYQDKEYPELLKQISHPPLVLFALGNKAALQFPQIAIIGSRRPTHHGLKNAEQFAQLLAAAGFCITSGMAIGIDGMSHKGALSVGGTTIAVCGTGLKYCYPLQHRRLKEDILQGKGLLLSEFPLATRPFAGNFPRRNRIISGLSLGVLVVEAALRSGSLITAQHAIEQGRDVFAIPGNIQNPLAQGCHHLIRQGAKLVETAKDIIEELRPGFVLTHSKPSPEIEALDSAHRQLIAQIEYEITPMDVILLRSGLTAGELSSMLLTLELNGYVQAVPGGYVRAILNN